MRLSEVPTPPPSSAVSAGSTATPSATPLPLDAITVGDRHRKEMGDLRALADSINARGLLHPVVVTSDHTLVAGHRRLEAVRLLGWAEVPVTVVDVDDLLMAERDENEERKDFTPTEAVAIGRVIEERHRAQIDAVVHDQRQSAMLIRHGHTSVIQPPAYGPTRETAAAAVGMGSQKYDQAKQVVAAAEADPETFGDLPEQMDATGNVAGTHREMTRRKIFASPSKPTKGNGSNGPRHPLLHKTRRIDPNRVVQATVDDAAELMAVRDLYDFPAVDPALIPGWVSSLEESIRFLTTLKRNLNKELTRVQQ